MNAPDEVEFFVDDGTSVAALGEELVDFGQSQAPRWGLAIVVLLVVAVVVALAAQPQHKPAAVRSPDLVTSSVSIFAPSATSGLGTPIPIDRATKAIDLAVTVPVFLLQPGHLYKVTDGTAVGVSLDRPGLTLGTNARLVVDAAANRVWVVETAGGGIIEFDARNLHRLRTLHTNESVRDAAALRGHLYLARATGLADIAPGADRPRIISELDGGYIASVAADPKRGRVLALVLGNGASIRQVTAAGTVLDRAAPAPVGGGTLRITTEGTIWLGGFGSSIDGAVLARLDPKTLQPVLGSPVASRLGASSWLEAAGDHDVWVRSGGDGEGLWCVDGRTGSILQYWPQVRGAVTSRHGTAFVLMEGLLVPLVLQDCTG